MAQRRIKRQQLGTDVNGDRLRPRHATADLRATHRPEGSYTTTLMDGGPDLTARKVAEEATEILIAAKNHAMGTDDDQRLAEEVADLLFHTLVVLREREISPALVVSELQKRHAN